MESRRFSAVRDYAIYSVYLQLSSIAGDMNNNGKTGYTIEKENIEV
jgi:hypothetical protein